MTICSLKEAKIWWIWWTDRKNCHLHKNSRWQYINWNMVIEPYNISAQGLNLLDWSKVNILYELCVSPTAA
jgi:hypothetical protein